MSEYFSGQGYVRLSDRDANGVPQGYRWVGDASKLTLSLKTDTQTKKESYSGLRTVADRLVTGVETDLTAQFEEMTYDNLALGVFGAAAAVVAGSVTAEQIGPDAPVDGKAYYLKYPKVTSVVITDSAGTPATLTEGTHYTVGADHGRIELIDTSTFTAPFFADYSYGAHHNMPMFTKQVVEQSLRLDGYNIANRSVAGGRPIIAELYIVQFDPADAIDFINDQYGVLALKGSAIRDATKPVDDVLGQFGRLTYVD